MLKEKKLKEIELDDLETNAIRPAERIKKE